MKTLVIFGIALIVAITASVALGINGYQIERDILGWQSQAQVAGEAQSMISALENMRAGMEKWGMTSGHSALIFKTPATDMGLKYGNIVAYITRAKELEAMKLTNPDAYQQGLDDLRGNIREIDLKAKDHYGYHQGLVWTILAWAAWAMVILIIIVVAILNS